MALQLIFSVQVPSLEGGYETHFVKWDDVTATIRVFTGGTTGDYEVGGGNSLDYAPAPELYQVMESDGDTVQFYQRQSFPYAGVYISEHPAPGTILRTQCYGYDLYNVVADGNGGEVQGDLVKVNSTSCGFQEPDTPKNRILIYRTCHNPDTGANGQQIEWDTDLKQEIFTAVYEGVCSPYNLGANKLIDTWCVGTTKKEAFSVWDGIGNPPPNAARIVETFNSPTCGYGQQNPCGLYVADVQSTETAPGVFDVSIIASDTTNVEYSLNNFTDVQDSPLFSGLEEGEYIAYVRKK